MIDHLNQQVMADGLLETTQFVADMRWFCHMELLKQSGLPTVAVTRVKHCQTYSNLSRFLSGTKVSNHALPVKLKVLCS